MFHEENNVNATLEANCIVENDKRNVVVRRGILKPGVLPGIVRTPAEQLSEVLKENYND